MIGSETIQIVGGVVILIAFAQLAVLLYGTWRGAALARVQQGLANDLLRRRVDAETLHREVERKKNDGDLVGRTEIPYSRQDTGRRRYLLLLSGAPRWQSFAALSAGAISDL